MSETLQSKVDDFYKGVTARSKLAVIVPMFGYWSGQQQFDKNVLKAVLDKVYSSVHEMYFIFVAEDTQLPSDIANVLITKSAGGNAKGVHMDPGSKYVDYLIEGFAVAKELLKSAPEVSQFYIVVNPWVLLKDNNIDIVVDRVNRDDVKVVTGFDLRGVIEPKQFRTYVNNTPTEQRFMDMNFVAMKKYATDIMQLDANYQTHYFLGEDIWRRVFSQGFEVISSQRVPIYSFNVDWTKIETQAAFDADKAYFLSKWHYDPNIKYK